MRPLSRDECLDAIRSHSVGRIAVTHQALPLVADARVGLEELSANLGKWMGLAGLVGITANCDCVTNNESLIIGAIAGVIVMIAIMVLDKLKIDDCKKSFCKIRNRSKRKSEKGNESVDNFQRN